MPGRGKKIQPFGKYSSHTVTVNSSGGLKKAPERRPAWKTRVQHMPRRQQGGTDGQHRRADCAGTDGQGKKDGGTAGKAGGERGIQRPVPDCKAQHKDMNGSRKTLPV